MATLGGASPHLDIESGESRMSEYCGQCRQFTRTTNNPQDMCGAWEQPTQAKRVACGFFMPRKPKREAQASEPSSESGR